MIQMNKSKSNEIERYQWMKPNQRMLSINEIKSTDAN